MHLDILGTLKQSKRGGTPLTAETGVCGLESSSGTGRDTRRGQTKRNSNRKTGSADPDPGRLSGSHGKTQGPKKGVSGE